MQTSRRPKRSAAVKAKPQAKGLTVAVPAHVPAPEIARLLTAARKAHDAKKRAAGTVAADSKTSAPDYPTAEGYIREALRLRQEAHDLDPDHTDPAWQTDQLANKGVSHADMCAWMKIYLITP